MSEANSELLLIFFDFKSRKHKPKIAPSNRAKRDSIEFERSENQGQFFLPGLLIILKFLNAFRWSKNLYL
jgi:hypothetical protein